MPASYEKQLIGHLLKDVTAYKKVVDRSVSGELFIEERTKPLNRLSTLYDIALDFFKEYHQPITRDVIEELSKEADSSGEIGVQLLAACDEVQLLDSLSPLDFLIDELRAAYSKAEFRKILQSGAEHYNSGKIEQGISLVQSSLFKMSKINNEYTDSSEIQDNSAERLQRYTTEGKSGIFTGFKTLDRVTNGLYPGQLMVVAAGTGEGKSTLVLNIAYNAWRRYGGNVLYVTIENRKEDIERRRDSLAAKVPQLHLKFGKLTPQELGRVKDELEYQKHAPNVFTTVERIMDCTPEFIDAKLSEIRPRKYDLLVVDYVQIMSLSKRGGTQDHMYFKELIEQFRQVANSHRVPVITPSQVSRTGHKDKQPFYDDYSDALSQFIANTADIRLSLKNKNPDDDFASGVKDMEIVVTKHRDGSKAKFQIKANMERMMMQEVDNYEAEPAKKKLEYDDPGDKRELFGSGEDSQVQGPAAS